jgi:hypothetical protein
MPQAQSHRPMKLTAHVARTKPIRYGAPSRALYYPPTLRRDYTNTQRPKSAVGLGQTRRRLTDTIQHCRHGMRQWYLGMRYGEVSVSLERRLPGHMIADIVAKPVPRRRGMCTTATMHDIATNSASKIVGVDIVGGQPE